jgi:hypothetical protein
MWWSRATWTVSQQALIALHRFIEGVGEGTHLILDVASQEKVKPGDSEGQVTGLLK